MTSFRFEFEPPPLPGRIREFFRRHLQAIASHPVCALFFAAAFACALGVWFSNGAMIVLVPILALGWVLAAIGWWWAPSLSSSARIALILISGFALALEGVAARYLADNSISEIVELAKRLGQNPSDRAQLFQALTAKWTQLIETNEMVGNPSDRPLIDEQMRQAFAAVSENVEARQIVSAGRSLVVLLSFNTFLVLNPVVMRIAPNITWPDLPHGVTANVINNSPVGFMVVFTPPTIPITRLPSLIVSAEL